MKLAKKTIVFAIRKYQRINGFFIKWVYPWKPPTCRFFPSCSEYMIQAVQKYGVVKGIIMGIKRILRCNIFHPGGYDPVK